MPERLGAVKSMNNKVEYLRNPDVALRDEDQSGSMLFNPDTGEVLVINETGRFIWDLCASWTSIEDMVLGFRKNYEDLPEDIHGEVSRFVTAMAKGGFIASR